MNKTELAGAISSKSGLTRKQASEALEATLGAIMAEIKKGEKVMIPGFGTYHPVSRPARMGRNPRTGEPQKIAASKSVRFAVGSSFKELLNSKSAAKKAPAKKAPAKKAPAKKAAAKKKK